MSLIARAASTVLELAMLAAGAWALGGYLLSVVIGSLDPSIEADTRGPRMPRRSRYAGPREADDADRLGTRGWA